MARTILFSDENLTRPSLKKFVDRSNALLQSLIKLIYLYLRHLVLVSAHYVS